MMKTLEVHKSVQRKADYFEGGRRHHTTWEENLEKSKQDEMKKLEDLGSSIDGGEGEICHTRCDYSQKEKDGKKNRRKPFLVAKQHKLRVQPDFNFWDARSALIPSVLWSGGSKGWIWAKLVSRGTEARKPLAIARAALAPKAELTLASP